MSNSETCKGVLLSSQDSEGAIDERRKLFVINSFIPGAGFGLHTLDRIPKEEKVGEYPFGNSTYEEIKEALDSGKTLKKKPMNIQLCAPNAMVFINYSPEPNVEFRDNVVTGKTDVVTIKDVLSYEELLVNYTREAIPYEEFEQQADDPDEEKLKKLLLGANIDQELINEFLSYTIKSYQYQEQITMKLTTGDKSETFNNSTEVIQWWNTETEGDKQLSIEDCLDKTYTIPKNVFPWKKGEKVQFIVSFRWYYPTWFIFELVNG